MAVKEVLLLGKKCLGLHLGVDQVAMDSRSLESIGDAGESVLADCSNVVIDGGWKIRRRKGFLRKIELSVTSFFTDGTLTVFTTADTLYRVNADWTITSLRTGLTNVQMYYAAGPAGIYYTNGVVNGIVSTLTGLSVSWGVGTYYGPETTSQFSAPPVGKFLCWHRGRMLVAVGKHVWYSEYMSTNLFDLEKNLITLDSDCTGIVGVGDAIYISSKERVYAYVGGAMEEKEEKVVFPLPAIPGTMTQVHAKGKYSWMAIWATVEGVVVGAPDGSVFVATADRFVLPSASVGSGFSRRGSYFFLVDGVIFCANAELEDMPITMFSGIDLLGFGLFGDKVIGYGPGGIYLYEGDADVADLFEDINAYVSFPSSDYGSFNQKRHRSILVSGRTEGEMVVEVSADDAAVVSYNLQAYGGMRACVMKKSLNREQKGGRFAVTVKNTAGCDFILDTVAVTVLTLQTKPSGIGF